MSRVAGRSTRRTDENGTKDRIKLLVDEKLDAGLEYEALQLYRGQAARKAARGDLDGAAAIAEAGAETILARGYADSSMELARQLVTIFAENALEVTAERKGRISRLSDLYTAARTRGLELKGTGSEAGLAQLGLLQAKFLRLAIKWTSKEGELLFGDQALHTELGRCLFTSGAADKAIGHMVLGEQPAELAKSLLASNPQPAQPLSRKDRKRGKGLDPRARLLLIAVLHFIAVGNLRDANVLRETWKAEGGSDDAGILTLCGLVCKTCEYDAASVFQRLAGNVINVGCDGGPSDQTIHKLLAQIGKTYFGIMPPPSMLDNMAKMLGMG